MERSAGRGGVGAAGGTTHGAVLVACGDLDAFLQFGGGSWDRAAPSVLVEEAGGRWSDPDGHRTLDAPVVVFSNGLLHDAVLARLCTPS